jgi:hypothetical protein
MLNSRFCVTLSGADSKTAINILLYDSETHTQSGIISRITNLIIKYVLFCLTHFGHSWSSSGGKPILLSTYVATEHKSLP